MALGRDGHLHRGLPTFEVMMVCRSLWLILALALLLQIAHGVVYDVNMIMSSTAGIQQQQWTSIAKLSATEVLRLGADSIQVNIFEYNDDETKAVGYALESGQNSSVIAIVPSGPQPAVESMASLAHWLDVRFNPFSDTTVPLSTPIPTSLLLKEAHPDVFVQRGKRKTFW
jgi:hypothetical protein